MGDSVGASEEEEVRLLVLRYCLSPAPALSRTSHPLI